MQRSLVPCAPATRNRELGGDLTVYPDVLWLREPSEAVHIDLRQHTSSRIGYFWQYETNEKQ